METTVGIINNLNLYVGLLLTILYTDVMLSIFRRHPITFEKYSKYDIEDFDFIIFVFINIFSGFLGFFLAFAISLSIIQYGINLLYSVVVLIIIGFIKYGFFKMMKRGYKK